MTGIMAQWLKTDTEFQSPKTGLVFSHIALIVFAIMIVIAVFQSPKTGLVFSHGAWHNVGTDSYLLFQSPKTGLVFSHGILCPLSEEGFASFNPLKRVWSFLTKYSH